MARIPVLPDAKQAPFLIIGSGIAGLYTALKLSEIGPVVLLTKDHLEESNTTYAQGGIAAAIDPQDSPTLHYEDTMRVGVGLCLPDAVSVLVHEGPSRVRELMSYGVPFDLLEGEPALTKEAAHSRRRILHADGDATGREISRSLAHHVIANPRITVFEEAMVISLLMNAGTCVGVLALMDDGELQTFAAGATILCTGGCGQVYAASTNPPVATGDGIALAYAAGAAISNMEFVQFHPTALFSPPAPRFLISETVRGEGGLLRNTRGERFMPGYHELAELAPRDVVARSILKEMERTHAEHVVLDLSALTAEQIKNRFPNIYETCLQYGLDITGQAIPVAPAAHYLMGGIYTDLYGRTTLPGLFACGETSDPGVHGANRLASNSLLEGLVFGHRITEYLQEHPVQTQTISTDTKVHIHQETSPDTINSDRRLLKEIMSAQMAIVRHGKGLNEALNALSEIAADAPLCLDPSYLELQHLRIVARLMIRAAQLRTESRGSHFREDFPLPNPDWKCRIIIQGDQVAYQPVPDWQETEN